MGGYLTDAILDGGQFSVEMLQKLGSDRRPTSFSARDLREVLGFRDDAETNASAGGSGQHLKPHENGAKAKQHAKPVPRPAAAADASDKQARRGMDMSAMGIAGLMFSVAA